MPLTGELGKGRVVVYSSRRNLPGLCRGRCGVELGRSSNSRPGSAKALTILLTDWIVK